MPGRDEGAATKAPRRRGREVTPRDGYGVTARAAAVGSVCFGCFEARESDLTVALGVDEYPEELARRPGVLFWTNEQILDWYRSQRPAA